MSYFRLNTLKQDYEVANNVIEIRLLVVGSLADGLQCGQALRNVYINPNDTSALNNLEKALEDLNIKIKTLLEPRYVSASMGLKKFNILELNENFSNDVQRLLKKAKANEYIDENEIKDNTSKYWRPYRAALRDWMDANQIKTNNLNNAFNSYITSTITSNVVLSIIIILILSTALVLISGIIIRSLETFKEGLASFFAFLNEETKEVKAIDIKSNDEFGQMAKMANTHIDKIESDTLQDNEFVADVSRFINELKSGNMLAKIEKNSNTRSLADL